MKIETFEMERRQSTWENVVEMDLSESGIRPVSLRELEEMGLDVEKIMDTPLGYSQSNGTIPLRERLVQHYPGATLDHIEVTNGTSEANYIVGLTLLRDGDEVVFQTPNYMQLWGLPRSLGAQVRRFHLQLDRDWEPNWDELDAAMNAKTRLVYVSNPNNPTGSVLSAEAMKRIVARCESVGAYLLADEVYLGAEIDCERTRSFWRMSDRVIVTSGLSKAYGIPGVRIGWIAGPAQLVESCWSQHDYITIGPNKMSDRIAQVAVEPTNRERCYARTRDILRHNLPIARQWVDSFGGRLTWTEPTAGAIGLMKYDADTPSKAIAQRVRLNQSTLVVPGAHVGLEGHLRIWLGGTEAFLREGLRRIGAELTALFD